MSLDPSTWEVPSYDIAPYAEREHRYALVIPVINEGERIRTQLSQIAKAGFPIDVIVADGGSTDGSLDADFIETVNVRAVLTKTGPGKLSAQLRMAYAWCLQEGYDGIVTMDGNGKDGVEAIASFIAKLDEGCDYVQGSRYLRGGAAENTPLERTIANRLVHAPLLSIGAGHVFTDTTNGFRAYSARYLNHRQVQPFRDEFEVYGLLFYLTVRAGQLGMKVDHVPVVRRYPESGKVPTKIGGLASKLALLGETVFAATGGYTPKDAGCCSKGVAKRGIRSWLAQIAVLALILIPLLLSVWASPPYSPDSWALYELSQSIFGDFYRLDHVRSYASTSPYSAAFPPLFPTLIALADVVLGTGPRTGLMLAFACFAGFAVVSEAIGRQVAKAPWIGLGAACVLLLGPSMILTEMSAGRTIPLHMLLLALIVLAFIRGSAKSLAGAAVIGVLAGLAVMNRFDAIFLPVLVAGLIVWVSRRPAFALASLGCSLVTVSPWIAYSLSTFGSVFATDNAGMAGSLDPAAFVTDWWPDKQPDWSDDPAAWADKVIGNIAQLLVVGVQLSITAMGLAVAGGVAAVLMLQQLIAQRHKAWRNARHNARAQEPSKAPSLSRVVPIGLWPVIAFAGVAAAMMVPQALTGYLEYRYYSAILWLVFLLVLCALAMRSANAHQARVFGRLAACVTGVFGVSFVALQAISGVTGASDSAPAHTPFETHADIAALKGCLGEQQTARVLVVGDDNFAARAGAVAGLQTLMEPRNIAEGRLDPKGSQAFVEAFEVDFVMVAELSALDAARSRFPLKPVPACPLMLFEVAR